METKVETRSNDGRTLAGALLSAPPGVLATALVLIRETPQLPAVWSRGNSFARWSDDDPLQELSSKAEELEKLPAGDLALQLDLELNNALGIEPRDYAARRDIEDNADEIVSKAIAVLRKRDKDFQGSGLKDLVAYQAQKLVAGIGKKLEDLSEDERQEVVASFRVYLEELPSEQLAVIKQALGVDQLSDGVVRQALISGTAARAFANAVEITGFSAYTFATSSLVDISSAIGLGRPFAVQAGPASTIRVLARPWFVLLLMGGGGYFEHSRGQGRLRRGLAPLIVAQLVTADVLGEPARDPADATGEFIGHWADALANCRSVRSEYARAQREMAEVKDLFADTHKRTGGAKRYKKEKEKTREQEMRALAELLKPRAAKLTSGEWHQNLAGVGFNLSKANQALEAVLEIPVSGGFFVRLRDGMRKGWKEASSRAAIDRVARDAANQLYDLFLDGTEIDDTEVTEVVGKLRALDTEVEHLGTHLEQLEAERREHEQKRNRLSTRLKSLDTVKSEAEKRYLGLGKVQ